MATFSFDIVSDFDRQELVNAKQSSCECGGDFGDVSHGELFDVRGKLFNFHFQLRLRRSSVPTERNTV